MIDVVIDLNLHHEEPSYGQSTRLYVYNRHIDPLAAGGTVIIANRTENVPYTEDVFLMYNTKSTTNHLLCEG